MLQPVLICFACLLFLTSSASAFDLDGSCSVRFTGDSTLHGFSGTGRCEPFRLTIRGDSPPRTLSAGQVEVKVSGLDTDNAARDKTMRGMFDAEAYPLIRARFNALDPDLLLQAWQKNQQQPLPLELQIRQITRPVKAQVKRLTVTGDKLSITLEFDLSLRSFQLDPPSVLGIIRVADRVQVQIEVALSNWQTPATTSFN
jgi:polyisoprenoid-binding protein YceI